jgi:hypothetical protein
MHPAQNWTKFNAFSDTFLCRQPNVTQAANSGFAEPGTTASASSRNVRFRTRTICPQAVKVDRFLIPDRPTDL